MPLMPNTRVAPEPEEEVNTHGADAEEGGQAAACGEAVAISGEVSQSPWKRATSEASATATSPAAPAVTFDAAGGATREVNDSVGTRQLSFNTLIQIKRAQSKFVELRLKPQVQQLPGMPLPPSLALMLSQRRPTDASPYEKCRDGTLRVFAYKRVSKCFTILAVLMCIAVVGWGLIIAW